MHNFAVMDTARNGVIHKTIKAVEIEDKDTYFEIFKTSKNTTIATTAYNGSIHKNNLDLLKQLFLLEIQQR